jgi:serine/threonine-protein kinase RsbW
VASNEQGARSAADAPPRCRRAACPLRLRLFLPNTREALEEAIGRIRILARGCRCPVDVRTNLEIAVREALANAMLHGNAHLPHRRVFLRCYGGPAAGLWIGVRDQGAGFDPEQVPDPRRDDRRELAHGRGLLMMRSLSDGVAFRRGGREVVLYYRASNGR